MNPLKRFFKQWINAIPFFGILVRAADALSFVKEMRKKRRKNQ